MGPKEGEDPVSGRGSPQVRLYLRARDRPPKRGGDRSSRQRCLELWTERRVPSPAGRGEVLRPGVGLTGRPREWRHDSGPR